MSDAPIPAATVIIVRDLPEGNCELLMVERAGGMAFAAGAMVFPGGRIDEADRCSPGSRHRACAGRRDPRGDEETAVPIGLSPVPDPKIARALQDALIADQPLAPLLEIHGIGIDAAALTSFARWVPQFHAVRRFDTLFYVAQAPPGECQPRVVEAECAAAEWVRAPRFGARERGPGAADLPHAADARAARATLELRRDRGRRAGLSGRTDHPLGGGAGRRQIHHHPVASRLPRDRRAARRTVAGMIRRHRVAAARA